MLKTMRKNLKSLAPTLWFVIAAFIISIFAVWGGAGRLGEGRNSNTIASVGKEKISTDLYVLNLRQRIESVQKQFKELDSKFIQQLNIPQQVLEQMIQQSLLLQASHELGLRVSNQEILEKIKSYPVFQKDGEFIGFEEYKRILEWNRIAIADFEKGLRSEILLEKTVQVLTSGVSITEDELWENYKIGNETARIEYIPLETKNIEIQTEFSADSIQEFFDKHRDDYRIPEKREASYVFFNSDAFKKEVVLADKEIEAYYKDNTSQFTDPEKVRVSRIFLPLEDKDRELIESEMKNIQQRIADGDDFGHLAKIYSKDTKAGESGDWGLFEWQSLTPLEKEKISALAEGEVSKPIELEDGFALVKVTEKSPEIQKPLEQVHDQVQTILKDQKAREIIDKKVAQLEKSARKEKSLEVAAKRFGYEIKSSGLVKEGESIDEEIDPSGSISTALFSLKENEVSSPLYTYKGIGLAELRKIEAPRQAELEEVTEDVQADLAAERKKQVAFERITKIKTELSKKSFETIAEENNLEYKTVEEHKRNQYLGVIGENADIDRLVFSLPLNEVSDPVAFTDGYALIRVLSRKEVTREDFQKNLEAERESQLEMKKNKLFASWMSQLRKDMGVKIRYDTFLKINSDILSRFTRSE
ncbi:MAG: SurA N-terminal domain-containing protein [Candidatus Aminicenantes bacterium]|nr:SurA N-terminal domain-containing protein [Candidatus Aminicenantes bacterium]